MNTHLHWQGRHRMFKSHGLFACMNNTTDLNCKQDGCWKGISCRLINSCCATGATVASDTTASASAKTPNFRLAFPSAFVVVAAQLDDMSFMACSSMSDQSPLTLTVPAEPTENDFLDIHLSSIWFSQIYGLNGRVKKKCPPVAWFFGFPLVLCSIKLALFECVNSTEESDDRSMLSSSLLSWSPSSLSLSWMMEMAAL